MKTISEVEAILAGVKFRDWKFVVLAEGQRAFLVIEFLAPCSVTGELKTQRSRKWMLSPHMTKGEIVQTAFLAVRTALEHELREDFQWRGEAIFGPHFDIELLHELCVLNGTEVRA